MSIADALAALTSATTNFGSALNNEVLNKGKKSLSIMPYAQVGDLNMIPFDISAVFEGAEDYYITRQIVMNVETDGSLAYLRTGTDGSTSGVYLSYIDDILSGPIKRVNRSSKEYRPSFLQPNTYVKMLYSCEEGLIAGIMADKTTNADVCGFIAYVDGSLSAPAQRAVLINNQGNYFNFRTEIIKGNDDYFYAITPYSTQKTGVTIYRIPKTGMSTAGAFVVPETIPNWTYEGFRKSASTATPEFFDVQTSTNVDDNPLVLFGDASGISGNPLQGGFFVHASYSGPSSGTGGKIRVRWSTDSYFVIAATAHSIRPFLSFSFTMDLTTKVIKMDTGTNVNDFANVTRVGNSVTHSGTAYSRSMGQVYPYATANTVTSAIYHAASRQWISYNDNNIAGTSKVIARGRSNPEWTTRYDALQVDWVMQNTVAATNLSNYPTAAGGSFSGSIPLPNGYQLTSCIGRDVDGNIKRSYARLKRGAYGFTYKALNKTAGRVGYEPTLDRKFVTDLGFTNGNYIGAISHVSGTTVKCSMHSFIEGYKTVGHTSLTENLNLGGTEVSCDPAVFGSVKSAVLAAKSVPVDDVLRSLCTIYMLDQAELGFDKPLDFLGIAVVEVLKTDKTAQLAIAHITAVNKTNNVYTSMTIDPTTVSPFSAAHVNCVSINYDTYWMSTNGGLVIYTTASKDGIVIGAGSKTYINYVGNHGGLQFAFHCGVSNGKYAKSDWSTYRASVNNYTYNYAPYFATERGFGQIYQSSSATISDAGTKMNLNPVCKTSISEWVTNAVLEADCVLAGQYVSGSYNVFISQIMPLMMDGVKLNIPPISFNISDYFTVAETPAVYKLYLSSYNGADTATVKRVSTDGQYKYWLALYPDTPPVAGSIEVAEIRTSTDAITDIFPVRQTHIGYYDRSGQYTIPVVNRLPVDTF